MNSVDYAYEGMVAQEWENQNKPVCDEEVLHRASIELGCAIEELNKACDSVNDAAEALGDSPIVDRAVSIMNDMEDILSDLRIMQEKWRKGEV